MVDRLHPQVEYPEQGHDKDSNITFSNNPFKYGKDFLNLALDDGILGVVASYIGKKFMLQQAIASRYYPFEKRDFGSWQWHHDAWGRKINVMILLTDVTEEDQYMNYMRRSHKKYHSYERTTINDRFTEAEVQNFSKEPAFKCIGPAGTVFIFDANGFHRGNRSLGAARDSIIIQYTAGRYLWDFDIPAQLLEKLSESKREFLDRNPNIHAI